MTSLRFGDVRSRLPELDELRPLLDRLLTSSVPDSERTWAASGELETTADRLLAAEDWRAAARELADQERTHLECLYELVLQAVEHSKRGDDTAAAEALLEAAALEEQRDRPARAQAYAESAADAARRDGNSRVAARAIRRQGRAARALGRLADAERLYASGHELARDAGDMAGAAEGAIGAGNVLEDQGRWQQAAGWYSAALELLANAPTPGPEQWHAALNLHVVTRSLGNIDQSLAWLRHAEELVAALEDPAGEALIHNAWGQLHLARGELGKAVDRFRDALAAPAGAWAQVNFRLNLGEALLAQGRTLDAAEEAREAEREALAAGIAGKLPEVYRLLGRVVAARGNADAFVFFERALEIAHERRLPPIEDATTLQAYAEVVRAEDPERAEELHQRAMALFVQLGVPERGGYER